MATAGKIITLSSGKRGVSASGKGAAHSSAEDCACCEEGPEPCTEIERRCWWFATADCCNILSLDFVGHTAAPPQLDVDDYFDPTNGLGIVNAGGYTLDLTFDPGTISSGSLQTTITPFDGWHVAPDFTGPAPRFYFFFSMQDANQACIDCEPLEPQVAAFLAGFVPQDDGWCQFGPPCP